MGSLEILESFGFLPYIRRRGRKLMPHLSLRFRDATFHIDSVKGDINDYNLITHAHSDHYGQRNMDNENAIASTKTAKILETVTNKKFSGITFNVGENLNFDGLNLKIKTYDTGHISGSSAFLIQSECKILVTGDVKDWRVPRCDVLITESTYGHPEHTFEDEIDRIVEEAMDATYGVYPIGKAQRVARILVENGYHVKANQSISRICKALGIEIGEEDAEVELTTPKDVWRARGKRFVITAQKFYRLPRIVLSDHLDYGGILKMVEHSKANCVLFYHGKPSEKLIEDVKEMGKDVFTLKDLDMLSFG
ncbi:MBL fold metallo-hydrolase [Archaeoglobales archaeon]|nr:MAG: MBL fold metallo-hydrolase [Archaeoglobales archaeon]